MGMQRRRTFAVAAAAAAFAVAGIQSFAPSAEAAPTGGETTKHPATLQPSAAKDVQATGRLGKAVVSWQPPVTNPGAVTGYRVSTNGATVTVPASTHSTGIKGLKHGTTYAVTVFALGANGFVAPPNATTAEGTKTTLKVEGAAGSTGLKGKFAAGGKGLKGKVLKVLTKKRGKWVKVAKVTT